MPKITAKEPVLEAVNYLEAELKYLKKILKTK
jgi:hypothetical protein